MAMTKDEIIERIQTLYPDAALEASGSDCSFEVLIVSPAFDGLSTIKRQQPILGLFKAELATGKLHALGIKARTPAEHEAAPPPMRMQLGG
jgi:acid stress-induced BolA-like protein IbaG/YrbA